MAKGAITGAVLSLAAVLGSFTVWSRRTIMDDRPASPRAGSELALVFITAPTCAASMVATLPRMLEEAKRSVQRQATIRGQGFATLGISQSRSAREGIKHLERFGQFDEFAAGRSWYNVALLRYVYAELIGPPATPQVLVVERIVGPESAPSLARERVLLRRVGIGAIEDWVEGGAPVPVRERVDTLP